MNHGGIMVESWIILEESWRNHGEILEDTGSLKVFSWLKIVKQMKFLPIMVMRMIPTLMVRQAQV